METNFNFKSSVCTSIEQSERLLGLGLKKETADMGWVKLLDGDGYVMAIAEDYSFIDIYAWSLDRLWKLMPKVVFSKPALHLTMCGDSVFYCTEDNNEAYEKPFSGQLNIYDNLINCIEWLIKEEYFNKEYLV